MRLATMAVEENGCVDAAASKMLEVIWPAVNQYHALIGLIGPPEGRIEGMVVVNIGQLYYSEVPCCEEKLLWVHPDYRSAKGGRARKLCEFSKRVADKLEMPLLIGVLSNTRTSGKVKMYTRIFGEPAGAFFLYNAESLGHKVLS